MKKTKKGKKKLSSLILLMFITIVMLSTATYAWFTANQTVTVNSLDVKVEARNGLMISTDGFQWKTVITNDDITGASTGYYPSAINQIPEILEAVSSAGQVETSGYLGMYSGAITIDNGTGDFLIASSALSENDGDSGYYIAFDLFLRMDLGGDVYLTTSSKVKPTSTFADKGLQNSARVGFLNMGETTADDTVANIQALNNEDSNVVYIWEPNYDTHSSFGVAAGLAAGMTLTQTNSAQVEYDGIYAPIVTPIVLGEANRTDNSDYFAKVTPAVSTKATYSSELLFKKVFTLPAGVTKIRTYMWIEGQDIDCENNASGTNITFDLQFSANSQ